MGDNENWDQMRALIVSELERLNTCYDTLTAQNISILIEIAVLKVKAGLWGLIGGAIPVVGAILTALAIWMIRS